MIELKEYQEFGMFQNLCLTMQKQKKWTIKNQ